MAENSVTDTQAKLTLLQLRQHKKRCETQLDCYSELLSIAADMAMQIASKRGGFKKPIVQRWLKVMEQLY